MLSQTIYSLRCDTASSENVQRVRNGCAAISCTPYGFYGGEATSLLWVLLPNKTQATYEEMFKVIHDAILATFGNADVGGHHILNQF